MSASNFGRARVDLAAELWEIGAVLTADMDHPLIIERTGPRGFERGFALHGDDPTKPLVPIYFNLRAPDNPKPGPLLPDVTDRAARCMLGILEAEYVKYQAVAGVPHAGDPFADALARLRGVPRLSHTKGDAGERPFPACGPMPGPGTQVLIVDDVITTGASKMPTIDCLRRADFAVTDIVVLVDREQGGIEEMHDDKFHVHAVFTLSWLLQLYYGKGVISIEMYDAIAEYIDGGSGR